MIKTDSKKTQIEWSCRPKRLISVIYVQPRISICDPGPNLRMVHGKGKYHLVKELEQLKNSSSAKSAAAKKLSQNTRSSVKWDKAFKNVPSKICEREREPLKNLKVYVLLQAYDTPSNF